MITTRISSKGQVVIPREVREKLGLKEGEELEVRVLEDNSLVLKRIESGSWRRWRGALKSTDVLRELEREHREEIERDERHAKGT